MYESIIVLVVLLNYGNPAEVLAIANSIIVSLKAFLHARSPTFDIDILLATLFVYNVHQHQRVYANFKQAERYSYTTTI